MNSTSAITGLLAQASESAHDPWADFLFGFDNEQRFALIIVALGCVTGVIITLACIASASITKAHQRRIETELKREMLDRGMSAEEVAQVVEASVPDDMTKHISAIFGRKR
jgi:hypothetical protein